jgi:hypothetical protein
MKEVFVNSYENDGFTNIVYKDEEYLLVDSYTINHRLYCQFSSFDKNLFLEKRDKKYYSINDLEVLNKLRELANLNKPEFLFIIKKAIVSLWAEDVKEIDKDTKEKMIDFVYQRLKKGGCTLSEQQVKTRLRKVKYFTGHPKASRELVAAFYHPGSDSILIPNIEDYENIFHESVHALGGKRMYENMFKIGTGFIEGGTQLATLKSIKKTRLSSYMYGEYFNFKSNSYNYEIAIMWQLEYLLGKSSIDSITSGDTKFFKEFIDKYGMNIFLYARHTTNKINAFQRRMIQNYNPKKLLFELQDKLLTHCFDKDFTQIKSLEDATRYLNRLNNFGGRRVRTRTDSFLEEYYNKKLIQVKEHLLKLGIEEGIIDEMINNHQYKQVQFAPMHTSLFNSLIHYMNNQGKFYIEAKNIPFEHCSFYAYKIEEDYYMCATLNGIVVYTCKGNLYEPIRSERDKITIINETMGEYEGKRIPLEKIEILQKEEMRKVG